MGVQHLHLQHERQGWLGRTLAMGSWVVAWMVGLAWPPLCTLQQASQWVRMLERDDTKIPALPYLTSMEPSAFLSFSLKHQLSDGECQQLGSLSYMYPETKYLWAAK